MRKFMDAPYIDKVMPKRDGDHLDMSLAPPQRIVCNNVSGKSWKIQTHLTKNCETEGWKLVESCGS